jgi:hypothetical protein
MQVEGTFGMLKGRFRILLKRVDIPWRGMLDLVMICICLHMCIVNLDGFYVDSALKVQKNAEIETNTRFGNLKWVDIFKVVEETNEEVTKSKDGGWRW